MHSKGKIGEAVKIALNIGQVLAETEPMEITGLASGRQLPDSCLVKQGKPVIRPADADDV